MTGIEFLQQVAFAERQMNNSYEKVERCRCAVERITATLSDNHVSSSRNVTAHEDAIIRLMEAEEEYARLFNNHQLMLENVMSFLNRLKDRNDGKLLELYYLKYMKAATVAKQIHIARSQFYIHHDAALKELDELLKTSDT